MSFRLTDEQIAREVAANLGACARLDGFDRDGAGWDEVWQGLYAILAGCKKGVRRALGLDPRRSALFAEFPDLLWAACDPQQPILYAPVFREFGYAVFDGGPSVTTMRFDPWTGRALPASVRDAYFDEAETLLGREVGLLDDALDALPDEFSSEAWWIERGL